MKSHSAIARLKEQIDAEAEAAQLAMYGPAQGISRHQFITARMERMGRLHEELKSLIGDEADYYLISAMEKRNTFPLSQ
jgi:hypothetical protein